jgi:hypothetical protein
MTKAILLSALYHCKGRGSREKNPPQGGLNG